MDIDQYMENISQLRYWYEQKSLFQAHNPAKKVLDAAGYGLNRPEALLSAIKHLQAHCEPESPLGEVAQNLEKSLF